MLRGIGEASFLSEEGSGDHGRQKQCETNLMYSSTAKQLLINA